MIQNDYIIERSHNYQRVIFPESEVVYLAITWDFLNDTIFELAKKINKDAFKRKNQPIHRVVSLAKAGWPMTNSLMDLAQIEQFASVGVKSYQGINQRSEQPTIYQDISVDISGENILLFDDIIDTGRTLEYVSSYLEGKAIKDLKTASLFVKPHSTFEATYFEHETSDWIVMPHDFVETAKLLVKKWEREDLPRDEMKIRLMCLNFKEEWVDYYFNEM